MTFRRMEEEEYNRNFSVGEIIAFDKEQLCCKTNDFPTKIGTTTYEGVHSVRMMENSNKNDIVLVKGYKIDEQLTDSQSSDENLDGAMHVSYG